MDPSLGNPFGLLRFPFPQPFGLPRTTSSHDFRAVEQLVNPRLDHHHHTLPNLTSSPLSLHDHSARTASSPSILTSGSSTPNISAIVTATNCPSLPPSMSEHLQNLHPGLFLHSDFRPSLSGLPGLPFDPRTALDLAAAAASTARHHSSSNVSSLSEPMDFYSQRLRQLAGGSSVSPSPASPGFSSRKSAMTPPSPVSPDDGKWNFFQLEIHFE